MNALPPISTRGRRVVWHDRREHPTEGIVGRNTVLQLQKLAKPLLVGLAELLDLRPPIGPTDDCDDRDDHDLDQQVSYLRRVAAIFERGKVLEQRAGCVGIYGRTSSVGCYHRVMDGALRFVKSGVHAHAASTGFQGYQRP
jgi:hypothetical protein